MRQAKETRSGNPSSTALKPADEMAFNLSSRGSSEPPIETVANDVGIAPKDSLVIAIFQCFQFQNNSLYASL